MRHKWPIVISNNEAQKPIFKNVLCSVAEMHVIIWLSHAALWQKFAEFFFTAFQFAYYPYYIVCQMQWVSNYVILQVFESHTLITTKVYVILRCNLWFCSTVCLDTNVIGILYVLDTYTTVKHFTHLTLIYVSHKKTWHLHLKTYAWKCY